MPNEDLEQIRRFYAEEIAAVAGIRSPRLIEAFATVERERYVGPGPWSIPVAILSPDSKKPRYRDTADADPRHVYHNVLIGLDVTKGLNNGEPSSLATWIDALDLQPGASVLHVGCGVGYYTAIMAHVVGRDGRVVGVELEDQLARRADTNLTHLHNVRVVQADATVLALRSFDRIFINAGVTHPLPLWLDQLNENGRMIFPLTQDSSTPTSGIGLMTMVEKKAGTYRTEFVSQVMVFHCAGARTARANEKVKDFFARGQWDSVRFLRRDAHIPEESCCLHADEFCLSQRSGPNA
jgi:protein-L-isoaspartate(D-aspartate) O-methyltransferase